MDDSKVPQVLPEGTTHFCPSFGRYPTRAFKLKGHDQWAYWTGFDWHDLGCSPVPSIRRQMIDVRPLPTGPSIAELIEQRYLKPLPFKCTAAPVVPSPWNGPEDGLPPVGLEVEVLWSSACGAYVKALVVGHDREQAVFRFTSGEREGEYRAERCTTYNGGALTNFRPIRTPEQLAAEERERIADDLVQRFAFPTGSPVPWKDLFLQMYDCGVLKAGKP